ncbi:hypothetical protein SGRIM128S_05637 [Streptomyces griseomycini]
MFVYIAMGVAPFAQVVIGQTPTPMVGPRQDLVTAIAMVLVGCAAYDLGALLASRRPPRRRAASARGPGGGGSAVAHPLRLRLLVLLAFTASAFYVLKLGGPAVFFASRQEINETVAASGVVTEGSNVGSAFLKGFGQVPALLALLFLHPAPGDLLRPQAFLDWQKETENPASSWSPCASTSRATRSSSSRRRAT